MTEEILYVDDPLYSTWLKANNECVVEFAGMFQTPDEDFEVRGVAVPSRNMLAPTLTFTVRGYEDDGSANWNARENFKILWRDQHDNGEFGYRIIKDHRGWLPSLEPDAADAQFLKSVGVKA